MGRYVFLAVIILGSLSLVQILSDGVMNVVDKTPDEKADKRIVGRQDKQIALSGRKIRIKAGRGGHFFAQTRMNNHPVEGMIDLGATMVTINETTARKIGIRPKLSDFKHKVNTANGITKIATATIRKIQIGNISVYNVPTGIARDSALSGTLLGMSFMKQLKSYEVKGGELLLVQ